MVILLKGFYSILGALKHLNTLKQLKCTKAFKYDLKQIKGVKNEAYKWHKVLKKVIERMHTRFNWE